MRFRLLFVLTLLICLGCEEVKYDLETKCSRALLELSKSGDSGSKQPLSAFTDFEWDQMFYFPSGVRKSKVNERLGFKFYSSFLSQKHDIDRDTPLIVFVKDKKVVHAFAGLECTVGDMETDYLRNDTEVHLKGDEKLRPLFVAFEKRN